MAENLTRQILAEHLVEGELRAGTPIALRVDQTLLQDATGTMALMQFEQLDVPRVKGRARRSVRGPQRHPARLQEPRRPPHAPGALPALRDPLLAARQRHLPLRAHRALRPARRDPRGGRLAHHHQRRARDDRDRRRRARRGGGHGRPPLRDRVPARGGGAPRGQARAAVGSGQGRDPRAAEAPDRARRAEQGVRVHRRGHGRPERA